MSLNKSNNKIRSLIENGLKLQHRTLFVIVGDKGRDQVEKMHDISSKAEKKGKRSILWCYKKELGFSMKHSKHKKKEGKTIKPKDNSFESFASSSKIKYCKYAETHRILGNTYGMLVLENFEALTPNLLARTIETVEGGGVIVILLGSMNSLKQLYTMAMDVHQRFRTEAHKDVVCRFNERFLLSLTSSKRCLVVDDRLTVLPISSHNLQIEPVEAHTELSQNEVELSELKTQLSDTQPVGNLVKCCKTLDQAKALLKFIEAISERKTLRSTVSLTAARGRGKSAALGLAVAAAVGFSCTNIYVTSPTPENLKTFFDFVFKGFDALEYQEHKDYELVQSTNPEFNKAIVRVNVHRDHRQTIQYIHPSDSEKLSQAELLVIDEAAAIPLPHVKAMLGPYLVFLASTINGYEGTGRSLSLKLLQQLRTQSVPTGANTNAVNKKDWGAAIGRTLHEVTLDDPIRYASGDHIEAWLTKLLCLDSTSVVPLNSGCPPPEECNLYYINRDTLFCYHKSSEEFLQRLVSLYVASHYKNTPNDLQMMSDAPAHHLFCLLGPTDAKSKKLPEILVVIQVCLEGELSERSVEGIYKRGQKAAGDLIPWTISEQFAKPDFAKLSGARIVRIATHPDYQGMGYGARALFLLQQYYEFKIPSIEENASNVQEETEIVESNEVGLLKEKIEPRKKLPPLLLMLSERVPEKLDYLGVSFGLTEPLLKFWKKAGFAPVYVRQTTNDITGEHTCIMLNIVNSEEDVEKQWLTSFWILFRNGFIDLLSYQFRKFMPALALSVLVNKSRKVPRKTLTKEELDKEFSNYDLKKLDMYCKNLVDYHLIIRLMPRITRMFFMNRMGDVYMSEIQSSILLGVGLQHKTFEQLEKELQLSSQQIKSLFDRSVRRIVKYFNEILEKEIEKTFATQSDIVMNPVGSSIQEELDEAAKQIQKKQKKELEKLKREDLAQFAIKGSEEEWAKTFTSRGSKSLVTVKTGEKRLHEKTGEVEVNSKRNKMDGDIKKKKKKKVKVPSM